MNIEERAKKVVINVIGENDNIKLESRFIEDLGADSLDQAEILMELEEEFDIEFTDKEMNAVSTVGEVLELIKEKL